MQGFDVMLVIAGLPYSKERIDSFGGCTFLKRARKFVLKPLTRTETTDAFRSLFAKVPEIGITERQIGDIAHFSQGHPYLVQLVGHCVYERMDELHGSDLGRRIESAPVGETVLASAEEEAYLRYREDVLLPVLDDLGDAVSAYLTALVSTMGDRGIMESGKAAIEALAPASMTPSEAGYYRNRLIRSCIVQSVGRGKVKFLLPYIPRALADKNLEIEVDEVDEDDWDIEV